MKNEKMKGFLRVIGIVVAAGGLITAIFAKDDEDVMREIAREEYEKLNKPNE